MIVFEDRFHERLGSVTTAGGTWSGNSSRLEGGIVGIRVSPAVLTTRYDLRIVDRDDFIIYERKGIRGQLVEDNIVPIPVRGILTVSILNATADGNYTFKLMVDNH